MIIFTLRTDKPEAEIGLFDSKNKLAYEIWTAHRQLAESLHNKIKDMLVAKGKDWSDIEGIVVYHGPGSFTGLRIGISVANVLAASLEVPIVGMDGSEWRSKGIERLRLGQNSGQVLPNYGAEPHITKPKS